MRSLGLITVLLMTAPSSALSAAPEPQPTVQTKTAAAPAKVVCREIQQTGTRFKRKACGRTADWNKLEEDATRARKEMGGQGANTAPSG